MTEKPQSHLRPFLPALLLFFLTPALSAQELAPRLPEVANPLFVDPSARDFSGNPDLVDKLESDPHHYFRFINVPFSAEICRRIESELSTTPSFNLHGDAHIEQYAVTDLGRGLTDFDDSSTGPALLDLLRFGVSLEVACYLNNCQGELGLLHERFLDGYQNGLESPEMAAPEPRLVTELRSRFSSDRREYLEWVESVMEPVPEEEKAAILNSLGSYVEAMLEEHPDLPREYFEPVDVGYLRMGVGSALDRKYLLRIRGSSEEPEDDPVLEIKEVRDLTGIGCLGTAQSTDPFRILVGQARIAYQPYRLAGYVRIEGRNFWIHAWVDNYKELDIRSSFDDLKGIGELVFDVGVQLGQGHIRHIAAPLDRQLRREQLRLLGRERERFGKECAELGRLTIDAWKAFGAAFDTTAQ